jgi:hypothetical protein
MPALVNDQPEGKDINVYINFRIIKMINVKFYNILAYVAFIITIGFCC